MEHGGNIRLASRETGIPEDEIIDFSASINPLGMPETVVAAIQEGIPSLAHYPEPFADDLAAKLGAHLGIDPRTIICGNGSTELIYLVVRALSPRRVLIPFPTFSEYARACRMQQGTAIAGHRLSRGDGFGVAPDAFIRDMAGCDMAFLCNPNNPTGGLLGREAVDAIAEAARHLSCYLVVDEAFIDFVPEQSVLDLVAKRSHLIVLRSLTKMYALAGLRVGYGVFPEGLAASLKDHKEPWSVNALGQKAGIAAISDARYKDRTLSFIEEEKRFLEKGLKGLGIACLPSAANYYLARMYNAKQAVVSLRSKGILLRDCSDFTGIDGSFFRVAVRTRRENETLLRELPKHLHCGDAVRQGS